MTAATLARWFNDHGVHTFPIKFPPRTANAKEPDTNGATWKGWTQPITGASYGVELGTLLVVDGDSPEAKDAIATYLPPTPFVVTTGPYHDRSIDGRGAHHYFRNPLGKRPSFIHRLGLPIESRNGGQYVVGPGSRHASNLCDYEPANWSWRWDDVPVLPADFQFDDGSAPQSTTADGSFEMPAIVLMGQRTDMLFRLLRSMKATGATKDDTRASVWNANLLCCQPPRPASWFPAWFERAWNQRDHANFKKDRVYVDPIFDREPRLDDGPELPL